MQAVADLRCGALRFQKRHEDGTEERRGQGRAERHSSRVVRAHSQTIDDSARLALCSHHAPTVRLTMADAGVLCVLLRWTKRCRMPSTRTVAKTR